MQPITFKLPDGVSVAAFRSGASLIEQERQFTTHHSIAKGVLEIANAADAETGIVTLPDGKTIGNFKGDLEILEHMASATAYLTAAINKFQRIRESL